MEMVTGQETGEAELVSAACGGGHGSGAEIRVLTGIDSFIALRPLWGDFLSRCGIKHPFVSHEWIMTWLTSFRPQEHLVLITAWLSGQLQAAFPLFVKNTDISGVRATHLMPWINTHSFRWDILHVPGQTAALSAVIDEVMMVNGWSIGFLPYIPATAINRTCEFMAAIDNAGMRVSVTEGMVSPRLRIDGSWSDHLASLSSSRRQSETRKVRKLLDQGGGCVEITVGRVDDLERRLEHCWHISRRTWKHAQGSSIAASEERKQFYSNLARSDRDWVVLGLLYRGADPVAFEFNLLSEKTLYNLKLGYDERESSLSPGQVLRFKMLEWAFNENIEWFDFMGNAAEYKNAHSTETIGHQNLIFYAPNCSGRLLSALHVSLKPRLREFRLRIRGCWPPRNTLTE